MRLLGGPGRPQPLPPPRGRAANCSEPLEAGAKPLQSACGAVARLLLYFDRWPILDFEAAL
eukprot:8960314-Alexandrium_andersonii.AAC.1